MDQYPRTEKIADQYYRIQKIGEGTYGAVYKAINLLTNQICALKKIRADQNDDGVSCSAIREISILKEMQHENIVKLQDVLQHGESLWIALEYLDMDLKKYMDSHPTIVKNPSMIKRFMHQMLSGIAHCHSHRIMHRDLKPANLLLDCHTNTLKLADFGMARAIQIPIRAYSHEATEPQRYCLDYKTTLFRLMYGQQAVYLLNCLEANRYFPDHLRSAISFGFSGCWAHQMKNHGLECIICLISNQYFLSGVRRTFRLSFLELILMELIFYLECSNWILPEESQPRKLSRTDTSLM
ncbi:hypothetical protein SAY86_025434 [Trapa natans]|uniref:cyclin-dependent kinase n=1 Tax=Trapa natans TaxID=22666 RepID=A0AAN7M8A4_TRANT|nr:hypothetical protein SAY86_025434 [Trapa natans]